MPQRAPRARRGAGRVLRAGVAVLATITAMSIGQVVAVASAAPTAWGATGAHYDGGIVCRLPGNTRVPLVSWTVDGTRAFSTGDVVARGSAYSPAPTSGATAPLAPGTAGLSVQDIAALAYLISQDGTGSNARIAETSAEVAAAAGGGATQASCLGQQGTSAAQAAALWADAQRFAGPYTVNVTAPGNAAPEDQAPVSVQVLSAAGVPTPGLPVTITAAGQTSTAVTAAGGVATSTITVPRAASTAVTATVTAPIGLTGFATRPLTLAAAAGVPVVGQATITANLVPDLSVSAGAASGLVLAGGTAAVTVHLTGTAGDPGTGTLAVVGPVQPPAGALCSSLAASAFTAAPAVWNATFVFAHDGAIPAGSTGALSAGCYATRVTAGIPTASPAVTASAGPGPGDLIEVSSVALSTQATTAAPPGELTTTVTAATPGAATVSTRVTAYGPLPTGDGRCNELTDWSTAKAAGTTAVQALAAQPGGQGELAATMTLPQVTALGCYSLAPSTTVTLDGRTLAVTTPPGSAGTLALAMAPTVTISNDAYDGTRGKAMTATATVLGSYSLPGTLHIGLASARVPYDGCRYADFSAPATGATGPVTAADTAPDTTARTDGDGPITVRTPVAADNLCYTVTATFVLDANQSVHAQSPGPDADTIFLAGAVQSSGVSSSIPRAESGLSVRALVVFGVALGVVLVVVVSMLIAALQARRRERPGARGSLADTPADQLFEDEPARS